MITINEFRMTDVVTPEIKKKPTARKRQQGSFIRGPVPCEWLRRCWPLPKRAMALGLFLWHILGMEKKGTALKVRPKRVKKEFGLSPKSVYRALHEDADRVFHDFGLLVVSVLHSFLSVIETSKPK